MNRIFKLTRRPFSSFYGSDRSTIYALATGGLRNALAVVRVSGPNCSQVVEEIGRFDPAHKLPPPRVATLRKLIHPVSKSVLDHGIILWFPQPRSYTGEDCCEFHIHGGPAVITSLLKAIATLPGCRMAEPGEFTKRAFLNGKMDLVEVDGLGDLIAAETEMQRVQALKQMSGSLSRIYEGWRDRIAKCLANSEAFIDFGEDESFDSQVMEEVEKEIVSLISEVELHLRDGRKGERLRNGLRIAILGKPNVGKSTLLNLLSSREAAIVSAIPGTTRDVVESSINFQGFPLILADTAGIRSTSQDPIEAEGIKRSLGEIESADLIILVINATEFSLVHKLEDGSSWKSQLLLQQFTPNLTEGKEGTPPEGINWDELEGKTLFVVNKLDLISESSVSFFTSEKLPFDSVISCKTSEGIQQFRQILYDKISALCGDPGRELPPVTQQRYRSELEACIHSLDNFIQHSKSSGDLALQTNHLKNAINSIGSITGHLGTEQILDIIFRDFCIGK